MIDNADRLEAEKVLLGQILNDNDIYFNLKISADHFEHSKHRNIFLAIQDILSGGDIANLVTVAARVKEASYLANLTSLVPVTANYEYYEKQLIRESLRQGAYTAALRLKGVLESNGEPTDALDTFDAEVQKVQALRPADRIFKLSEYSMEYTRTLEDRHARGGELPGYHTGFPQVDTKTLGLQNGKLYYFGARPSIGKSALLLNMALYSSRKGVPVGMISLESGKMEIMDRLTAIVSSVDSHIIQTGGFRSDDSLRQVISAQEVIHDLPFHVFDKPNCSVQEVKTFARRMVAVHGVKILFVDYLQLIRVASAQDRMSQTAEASMQLKDMARELDVPVVAAAQLRRDADERRPHLGDFQWSSQAEQDADVCILIHRPAGQEEETAQEVWLFVEKNRDGQCGAVKTRFHKRYVTFREEA